MNCIIVDDEIMSRQIVRKFVEKTEFLNLVHECSNAIDASNILENKEVDIMYLDIGMPHLNGIDFIKTLISPPQVVLITSSKNHALEAFEHDVVDYLVKPISYDRFLKASKKAKDNYEAHHISQKNKTEFYIKADLKLIKINLEDVLYIEAMADYVNIIMENNRYIVHFTMKALEKRLPPMLFARVHRSYFVNLKKIDYIEDANIYIHNKIIPIGASYKQKFLEKLNYL